MAARNLSIPLMLSDLHADNITRKRYRQEGFEA